MHNSRLYVSHWIVRADGVGREPTRSSPSCWATTRTRGSTTRTVAVGTFGSTTVAFEAGDGWGAHLRVLDVSAPEVIVTQAGEF